MEFFSVRQFEDLGPKNIDLVCKRNGWAIGTVFVGFSLVGLLCLYFAVTRHFILYYPAFVCAIFALFYRKPFFLVWKPTNWLLLSETQYLWINMRSFLNAHFPKDRVSIIRIPKKEIVWLQLVKERREVPALRSRNQVSYHQLLQIKLSVPEQQLELTERYLQEDLYEKPTGSRVRYVHYPVALNRVDSVLLVDWEGTSPRLSKVIQFLSNQLRILDTKNFDWGSWRDLSEKEADDMVLHLVKFGKDFDAIRLLRSKHKLGLKEAKNFVTELRTSSKSPSK